MGLDFGDYNAYFENKEKKEKQELLDKIKKVQDRLNNKDKAIKELQYERDLIFGNLCNIISNDLRNSVFNILKDFIKTVEATETTQMTATEISAAIEFMKKHVEVQAHPDILFYNEQPERVLIDLRYLTDTGNWIKKPKNIEENNRCYNLVKRILDLPEYKENQ